MKRAKEKTVTSFLAPLTSTLKKLPLFFPLLLIHSSLMVFISGCLPQASVPSFSPAKNEKNAGAGADADADATTDTNTKVLSSKVIVGETNWVPVQQVSSKNVMVQKSKAVGLVTIPHLGSRCTAFLIADDLIMTNWHCFPDEQHAVGARLYLDYLQGQAENDYEQLDSYLCDQLIFSHQKLDVAVLQCEGGPGVKYGHLKLENKPRLYQQGERIYVIHQNCDYYRDPTCPPTKKLSLGILKKSPSLDFENKSLSSATLIQDLFYNADTLGGSSGSPVLSPTNNKVIALHHNGHGLSPYDKGRGEINSGVPMSAIVSYVKNNYPEVAANLEY